ncbi:hypothetical protein CTAYLR_010495 [Chrysophaeum taylorii]|uniref:PH domain-containing protein n=1 Tax=Chrysophaeum taylorii TaxID=2483200 RepID=A0AAD7XNK4_9STRA|nr:hypothetical protein CTAYLR_010495 [Chrysophaeum taylorii]
MLEITYTVPLELLTAPQLKGLLEAHRVSVWDVTEARELRELAKQHGIEGRRLRGTAAIEAKAKEMLGVSSRLDRTIQCEPNAELGLVLRQVNEWAIVVEAQPKLEVRVGDVISAVDGKSVLLERYEDMFAALRAAKQASRPYTLTFRRAPFHRGWLCKRSRRKSGSILSGVLGWRKRFFVLAYGALAYYDEDPKRGGTIKGQFSLSHHAIIATAPKQFMSGTDRDPGIVLSKGPNDRLVLKAARSPSDIHEWAALLHIAIAHANGGNDLLRTETRRRLETELLKQTLEQEVSALVASSSCGERLAEDAYRAIAEHATRELHTIQLKNAVREDPYGELGPLARRLASRVRVASLDRVRTRLESRVSARVLLSSTSGSLATRPLLFSYACLGDEARFAVRLHTSASVPTVPVLHAVIYGHHKRVRASRRGLRALAVALGLALSFDTAIFFLLSCHTLYDNERDLDDAIISELALLEEEAV